MRDDAEHFQASVPFRNGGLLFLGLFAGLTGGAFWALSHVFQGMWVFFAPGPLALAWVTLLIMATGAAAWMGWPPVAVPTGGMAALVGILSALTAFFILHGFENSADEYAYVFQARTFLAGRLWNPPPVLGQALASDYTWVAGDKWVGQYPPGWPAILAVAAWCGLSFWMVTPMLGCGLVAAVRHLAKGSQALAVSAMASPFLLFTGASLHSHMAAALLGIGAVACLEKALEKKHPGWAIAAGLALGGLGLIRYDSAVLVGVPYAVSLLWRKRWRVCIQVTAGLAPCLIFLLWYHWRITGNPVTPVYWLGGRHADHLYFTWTGFTQGTEISLWRWVELIEWAGPGLVLAWGAAMVAKVRSRTLNPADWVFPLFVLTFLFYPFDGANRYGPRYYFEAFPFMVLAFRGIEPSAAIKRLCGLNLIYTAVALPFLAVFYESIVDQRMDLYRQARDLNLTNAVILVKDGPGKIWKMEPDDMARNGLTADGPVLYARADKIDEQGLRHAFPTRELWVYQCEDDECRLRKEP